MKYKFILESAKKKIMDNPNRLLKSKERKLPRPGDLNASLNDFIPGLDKISLYSNIPFLIPISPKDAKALGLKIPEASSSKNPSSGTSSKSSTTSKETHKSSIGKKVSKESKDSKNLKYLKKGKKQFVGNPRSFHATVKHSLKNLASRTARSIHISSVQSKKKKNLSSVITSPGGMSAVGRLKQTRSKAVNESDTSDRLSKEPSSKSMRQLFSMAESWSNNSITSPSDSCTCCHTSNPCPLHGKN